MRKVHCISSQVRKKARMHGRCKKEKWKPILLLTIALLTDLMLIGTNF